MTNTLIKLEDVNGQPTVMVGDLPRLRVGDPIGLRFRIARDTGGRHEVLEVSGQFRVNAVGLDASTFPLRQLATVDAIGKPPTWRSVKHPAPVRGPLAP